MASRLAGTGRPASHRARCVSALTQRALLRGSPFVSVVGMSRALTLLLGSSLLLAGGCVTKTQYDSALSDLDAARKANTDAKSELEKCQADLDALQSDFEGKLAATQDELEELRKQREAAEARLQAFKDLQAKFQSMIEAGDLQVYMRRGRMVVGLPSKVLFGSGKAELSKKGQKSIKKVAKVLAQLEERRIQVAGHTDNVPIGEAVAFEDNWHLSTARALTVTRFLIENGVKPENLGAAGYGEFDPVGSNKNKTGRRKNRRIELILVPDLSELPAMAEDGATG